MLNLSVLDNFISFLIDFLYKIIDKNKIIIIEKNDPVTLIDDKNNVFINNKNIVNLISNPSLE